MIVPGIAATTATSSDASPMRAFAPIVTIEVIEPRNSSSSTGWVPTSDGTSGSSSSPYAPLNAISDMQTTSARSG